MLHANEDTSWDAHDTLIWPATSRTRQLLCKLSHVLADDCEVTIHEFKDVWATPQRFRSRAIGVRIGSESSQEHASCLTIVRCAVNAFFRYQRGVASERVRQSVCANVARLLRQERERQGISMTLLAEKAGLSQQMVSYLERGLRNPTLETLLRITGALGIELSIVIKQAEGKSG